MEVLYVLLQYYERRKFLKGIQVVRRASRLTHIFFVDDTYIYTKAKENEADHILELLKIFERA